MAGGMTAFASLSNIIILRRSGATKTRYILTTRTSPKARNSDDNIQLQSGDVVVVPG